ncbi:hypothetical protein ACFL37_01435, partial [Candidatus Margulisiibacteriota bacterium]
MMVIKLLIAISVPFLLGVFGLTAVLKDRLAFFGYLERLALAFAVGVWLLALIMFSLPFVRIPLSLPTISLAAGLILLGLLPFAKEHLRLFVPGSWPRPKTTWFYVLLGLIIIKVLFAFWSALLKPIIGPDLITYYALAAKHTFLLQAPLHLFYEPPLPFLIESWTPICLGAWQDNFLPLFSPLLFISLLIIFFSSLRRYFSDLYSIFFTFLLAGLPLLLFHAGTAYADLPQALYYSAATLYLYQFIKEFRLAPKKAYSFLLLSALLLGISIWVKKSGIYYAGINISVLVFFAISQRENIQKKAVLYSLLTFALVCAPWLLYSRVVVLIGSLGQALPSLHSIVVSPQLLVRDMSWVVVFTMLRNMFLEGNWQLLWALCLALAVLYPKKAFRSPAVYLSAVLLLQLAALFVLYRFTGA